MVSALWLHDSQSLARSLSSLSPSIHTTLRSLPPTTHPRTATLDAEATQRSSVVVGEGGRSGVRKVVYILLWLLTKSEIQ